MQNPTIGKKKIRALMMTISLSLFLSLYLNNRSFINFLLELLLKNQPALIN